MKRKTKDTRRLDWLQKYGALINVPNTGNLAHICFHCDGEFKHFYGVNYRDVIDFAMREVS